ncbi:DUF1549 domain-containing protein [Paludisphaera borealis]|uniref:BIG2 domain-containing protein n=1 Tax=Paludisphaera borealis TaxID=1387353 RepID=A0A1U7CWE6_9BACT|nr:DUF1549 domain-containing protein [Paludisphaera borealis]APW63267.1 hypothetical protein BSF38_04831 [Paludisphaera borealis]
MTITDHRVLRWLASVLFAVLAVASLAEAGHASEGIEAEPRRLELIGAYARQQTAVTLRQADGTIADVTDRCDYRVEPPGVAEVSRTGVVRPRTDGRATLHIRHGSHETAVELQVDRASWRRVASYRTDVAPVLSKAGCNMGACHGNLSGKGGFRLSLRGDDPAFDWLMLTHDALGRRINRSAPDQSLMVLKPTGRVAHEGGVRFGADSPESRAIREWIASGASDDVATAPRLKSVRVFPTERIAAPGGRNQQLVVTAVFADGTERDVTRQAAYDPSNPMIAEVSADGMVRVDRTCEIAVAVRYMDGRAVSRLAFIPEGPVVAWNGPAERNLIDKLVFARLKALRIQPSTLSTDSVFLRRAYLDAIGRLPTPAETRAFLADRAPANRERMIDALLERPEFADFWALKWADLLRNEEKAMGQKGVWVFQRWLRDEIAADVPLDEMTRRIVAGRGSNWSNPPSSFYRTNRDPTAAAETVAQVFLGLRLQCAKCHNHPFDEWKQDDYYGLAAYFGNIARKQPITVRKDMLDKHEINGDEYIYVSGPSGMIDPRTRARLEPKPLHGDSPRAKQTDPLDHLASWLTVGNRQFTRNMANRVWYNLMGRGIVDPVDDFRDSNPPSNPELLDALSDQLEAGGMRLRPLAGLIMKSSVYQLGATPNSSNADDAANFSKTVVRLLPAEVLIDAISQALDVPGDYRGGPPGLRAVQLPGVARDVAFLETFGKPERLLTCECERSEATTLAQAFQMINGESVRRQLEDRDNRIGKLTARKAADDQILDELYLAALCREPSAAERSRAIEHLHRSGDRRAAWEDLAWALLNSKEFLLRH